MSDIAIRVEDLSKAYRIGLKQETADTMAGMLTSWLRKPLRNFQRLRRLNTFQTNGDGDDIIWALKDVSFDVKRGEVLGIIGRNGAGKSTLLKILSRITEPTRGRATIHGRVSSLLEVGTGFHPELTGRENVYLNGTILGMKKAEIDRKFDEIIDFSGVEKFLDTPVKRYSSGMKVRLAFAVAAHLEPEILIIDEVLAVGDAEFQKKCLGKMQDVAEGEGRTVLFVSHNMGAVRSLCSRCMLLQAGSCSFIGSTNEVVNTYMHSILGDVLCGYVEFKEKENHDGAPCMSRAEICSNGEVTAYIKMGAPIQLRIYYNSSVSLRDPKIGFRIIAPTGESVISSNNRYQKTARCVGHGNSGCIVCDLGVVPFMDGRYSISLWFGNESTDTHAVREALFFDVEPISVWDTGLTPNSSSSLLWWPVEYTIEKRPNSEREDTLHGDS